MLWENNLGYRHWIDFTVCDSLVDSKGNSKIDVQNTWAIVTALECSLHSYTNNLYAYILNFSKIVIIFEQFLNILQTHKFQSPTHIFLFKKTVVPNGTDS